MVADKNMNYRDDVDSVRKQIDMVGYVAASLQSDGPLGKGPKAAECLRMYPEFDCPDDEFDAELNYLIDELNEEVGDDVIAILNDIVKGYKGDAKQMLVSECSHKHPRSKLPKKTNLEVTEDIHESLPGRNIQDPIRDAVIWVASSPWSSRLDMMRDIRSLLQYVRDGELPEDSSYFIECVVECEDEYWDVGHLHAVVDTDVPWYHHPDVTIDDLRESDPSEITQSPSVRGKALAIAVGNSDDSYTREDLIDLAEDLFAVSTPRTAEGYVDAAGIESQDRFEFHVMDKISEIADQRRRELSRDLSNADWRVVGLKGSPEVVDGVYNDPRDAIEAAALLKRNLESNHRDKTAQEQLKEWVGDKEEEFRRANSSDD